MTDEIPTTVHLLMAPTQDVYERVQVLRVFETAEEAEVYKITMAIFYTDDPSKPKKVKTMDLAGVLDVARRAKRPTRVVFCEYDGAGQLVDVEVLRDPTQSVH
jgi:hypothetical protein